MSLNLKEKLKEYYETLDTLFYLSETLIEARIKVKYWQKDSEILLHKSYFHGITLHSIYSGEILNSKYYNEISGKRIIDLYSGKVILRAQLETFLMYCHIYVNPKNDDEKELRHNAWIYTSLLQRQQFPTHYSEIAIKQKEKDKEELQIISNRIKTLPAYKQLSKDHQFNLIEGKGRGGTLFLKWNKIFKDSGFDENHLFSILYWQQSAYSHSEGLTAIQLGQAKFNYNNDNVTAIFDLYVSELLICLLIDNIVKSFKAIEIKYNTLSKVIQSKIKNYVQIALLSKHS